MWGGGGRLPQGREAGGGKGTWAQLGETGERGTNEAGTRGQCGLAGRLAGRGVSFCWVGHGQGPLVWGRAGSYHRNRGGRTSRVLGGVESALIGALVAV